MNVSVAIIILLGINEKRQIVLVLKNIAGFVVSILLIKRLGKSI